VLAFSHLATFLGEAGATVGGSSAIGYALGFSAGVIRRDVGRSYSWAYALGWDLTNPVDLADTVAGWCGIFGVGAYAAELVFGV
jgi:hypothetical protein